MKPFALMFPIGRVDNINLLPLHMAWSERFTSLASSGNLTVGIIGLGYVGLPTAIGFHDAGFNVWGVDVSQ